MIGLVAGLSGQIPPHNSPQNPRTSQWVAHTPVAAIPISSVSGWAVSSIHLCFLRTFICENVGTTSGDTAREWPPEDITTRVTEHAAICSSGFPVWMEGVGAVAGYDDASAAADAAREGAAITHARLKYVYCDCCTRSSCCTVCPAGCGLFPMQVLFLWLGSSPSPRLSVLACNDAEVEVVEPEPPAPPRGTPTPPILAVAKASLHDFDVLALVGKVRGVCAAL